MKLTVIGTGSAGNCYVLDAGKESLILDVGFPLRNILPYISDFRKVQGCLLTHEHLDHAKGAKQMSMRGIKVYTSAGTKDALNLDALNAVEAMKPFRCGNFTVMAFDTQHDSTEPFGFLIRYEPTKETVLYATDTYYLAYTFPNVNYWIVECNFCEELIDSETNQVLKRRLMKSHMSLRRLKDALQHNDLSCTEKIVLVHLSDLRSNELKMMMDIEQLTGVETVAAENGMKIELTPF